MTNHDKVFEDHDPTRVDVVIFKIGDNKYFIHQGDGGTTAIIKTELDPDTDELIWTGCPKCLAVAVRDLLLGITPLPEDHEVGK